MICNLLIDIYSLNITVLDNEEISELIPNDYFSETLIKIFESSDEIITYEKCKYYLKDKKVLFEISHCDVYNLNTIYLSNNYRYFRYISEDCIFEIINKLNEKHNLDIQILDEISEQYIMEISDKNIPWLNNINIE